MGKSNAMPSLDTLFGGAAVSEDQITVIDDASIDEFPGHPYRLYTGKRHTDLLESVKEFGVLTPVTLRAEENGRYTLLSGYNRRHCNQLAGNSELPAVVRHNVSDGEAKLIITHSNRQRGLDELLPSEKAFAFQMELEGLKETRRELKKVQAIEALENAVNADEQEVCDKVLKIQHLEKSRETLAKYYEMKVSEIQQLIRLTHLCRDLLDLVDDGKIPDYVAVPLTFLSETVQLIVYRLVAEKGYRLDLATTKLLKEKSQSVCLDEVSVEEILSSKEGQPKPPKKNDYAVKIKPTIFTKYFTKGESKKEIQSTVEKALEQYFKREGTEP